MYAIDSSQIDQFIHYAFWLVECNKVMNLTGITDPAEIVVKHFVDSLTLLPYLDRAWQSAAPDLNGSSFSLADVGTGAGFPGLPIKIMRPQLKLVLVDSLKKRIRFLETVVANLSLSDVSCFHLRAEDAGRHPTLRDRLDAVTARAVAPMAVLAEYCLPLVKSGGYFWAMKGEADQELKQAERAIRKLAGRTKGIDSFYLPKTDMARTVITIKKIKPTPKSFPRANGIPKRRPLT
ncbi:MAG TPA: 16S rRNA (guanine(527)-N(7))-methyltransferase RsmG [Clostridiaceae bacterium]|nr:16S rRNA (guanine(527)-N(7))-methyltransferase RsmG [Clostridiaceae bacterium]